MLSKLLDLGEIVGGLLIAAAVGALAGAWWGVLMLGALLVLYVNLRASDDAPRGDR